MTKEYGLLREDNQHTGDRKEAGVRVKRRRAEAGKTRTKQYD